jgi:HlyD family secretion protein
MRRISQRTPFTLKIFATLLTVAAMALHACKPNPHLLFKYETARVTRGELVQHVTASGSLSAVGSVDVGSQVSGKIAALHVDFNSPVKKGQLVAEIDPTLYDAALRQSQGELSAAKADVVLRRQNLARKEALLPLKAASQLDVDQATAELARAEATVTIRQAVVDNAAANVAFCKITAPVDGIVISRKVDVGQTVIAAMTTPVLLVVAQDITRMNISAAISEADIGLLKTGQEVEFAVDAYPDDTFKGQVTQVRRAPTNTQNVVTYDTIISVENPDQKLFPGMTADVSIRVSERKDALKISNGALRYSPPESAIFENTPPARVARRQRLVYTVSPTNQLRALLVRVGISDGVETEIPEGVEEGMELVVANTLAGQRQGGPPPPRSGP